LPVLAYLEPLDRVVLKRILVEPKNSLIRQYTKLFEIEGIELTFTEEALDFIAEKALEFQLGARGLRSICEAVMTDAMFELPSQKDIKSFSVTKEYVEDNLSRSRVTQQLRAA